MPLATHPKSPSRGELPTTSKAFLGGHSFPSRPCEFSSWWYSRIRGWSHPLPGYLGSPLYLSLPRTAISEVPHRGSTLSSCHSAVDDPRAVQSSRRHHIHTSSPRSHRGSLSEPVRGYGLGGLQICLIRPLARCVLPIWCRALPLMRMQYAGHWEDANHALTVSGLARALS